MNGLIYGMLSATLLSVSGDADYKTEDFQTKPDTTRTRKASEAAITTLQKTTSLLGTSVTHPSGRSVGKVSDLVLDWEKGRIGYAVLELMSESGHGRKVAVPFGSLKPSPGGDHFVLNISEPVLAAAEGLMEGDWPGVEIFAMGSPAETESGSGSSQNTSDIGAE